MSRTSTIIILLTLSFLLTGCIVISDKTVIVREDEPKEQIEFESEEAGQLFMDEYKRVRCKFEDLGQEAVLIPFIVASHTEKKLSENAIYNDQVKICDMNSDGIITLSEARIYSSSYNTTESPVMQQM